MKKSKSLSCLERSRKIGRLIQKVGRTPNKVGQFYCQVVETKTWRTNHVWSTSFVENTSRPNPPRNLRNQRLTISVNLGNLWLKFDQSKQLNYAKQTQFFKKSSIYNLNENNGLQRKIDIGHLVKTNPNKANFTRYGG